MTKSKTVELGIGSLLVVILLFCLRSFLAGTTSFEHDNTYWEYPVFQFFAESLLNGHLPLWNPYEHGGEAFYPLLGAQRLFDPTDPLTVIIGGWFTHDTLQLNHWARVVKTLLVLLGTYLCVRVWLKTLTARLALFPLLLFSYYAIGSFREQGYLTLFAGIPWTYFFLQRIAFFDDRRWINWIGLGAFLGLNWQFYHFAPIWTFLVFFGVALALFHRSALARFWDRRLILTAAICLAMMGPNLFLFFTQGRYVFPVRMIPSDYSPDKASIRSPMNHEGGPENIVTALKLPYAMADYSGTIAKTKDFMDPLIPDLAYFSGGFPHWTWRVYHDYHCYLGILAWGLCLMGLLYDPSKWFRRTWGFCLFGMTILMLGKGGGLHQILYHLYPPISMLRHTIMLMPVTLFATLFLISRGLEVGAVEWKFDRVSAFIVVNATILFGIIIFKMPEGYEWPLLLPAAALLYFMARRWPPYQTFWALFIPPILFAGISAPNRSVYALWVVLSVGCFFLWQKKKLRAWAVVLFLTCDFGIHLHMNRPLYGLRPSPVKMLGIQTEAQPPKFPKTRGWYAYDFPHDPQAIRYLATLYRTPTVFSTPFGTPAQVNTFERTLAVPRWSSFLLPKTYFDLIHSDYPIGQMERAFAAGTDLLSFFGPTGNQFHYEVLGYHPGHLRIKVTTDNAGSLFWSDGWAPEWKATIDGAPVGISRADHNFKSVAVSAGVHEVEFNFRPTLFLFSVGLFYFLFFGSLGAMAWLTLREWEPKRRPSLVPEPTFA